MKEFYPDIPTNWNWLAQVKHKSFTGFLSLRQVKTNHSLNKDLKSQIYVKCSYQSHMSQHTSYHIKFEDVTQRQMNFPSPHIYSTCYIITCIIIVPKEALECDLGLISRVDSSLVPRVSLLPALTPWKLQSTHVMCDRYF